jgi:Tol biopolymer transport system component
LEEEGGELHHRLAIIVLLALLLGLAAVAPAEAAFPGANGKIALDGIYVVNPDGTGLTRITNNPGLGDFDPAWSPDGTKIAFASFRDEPRNLCDFTCNTEIYVVNADGSGQTRLTNTPSRDEAPTWSPDGTKIAFQTGRNGQWEIYSMNADGSNPTRLTDNSAFMDEDYDPAWSPDGTRIAFSHTYRNGGELDLYLMNPDGTGRVNLTPSFHYNDCCASWAPDGGKLVFQRDADDSVNFCECPDIWTMNANATNLTDLSPSIPGWASDFEPAWSPDGARIAFTSNRTDGLGGHLFVMNADGSAPVEIASGAFSNSDWQRLPSADYAHPQSAAAVSTSLVPLFNQCGAGGHPVHAAHAPPLGVGSCSPSPSSAVARVGSTSQGSAALNVAAGDGNPANGDQADVAFSFSLTDVQTVTGLDYVPNPSGADLTEVIRLRFTDRSNGYGGLSATAADVDFAVPVDCAATGSVSVGATCTANTTADAIASGYVQEQRQSVVQVFRVRVYDSGRNGTRENGVGDDKIFAHGGIFIP